MAADVTTNLKAFGLSTYESQAYTTLLLHGPADATTVAREADIPSGRVYDVLNSLVEKNLLHLQEGRPKRYHALPPQVALQNLLGQRKREYETRYDQLTRLAADLEQRLAPKRKGGGRDSGFYHVCIGETQTRDFLVEQILEARDEIVVSLEMERFDPEDDRLFKALASAADEGVSIRVMVPDADVGAILETPYKALIARTVLPHLGRNLHVRVFAEEQVPFGVIDGDRALIGVKNPLDPEVYFALVYVLDPGFGGDLLRRFDTLWERAELDVGDLLKGIDLEEALEAFMEGADHLEAAGADSTTSVAGALDGDGDAAGA